MSDTNPSTQTVTLFRPVGRKELDLIAQSDFKEFPPRLYFQPIFYPVLNEEYAIKIARDWNTKDEASGYEGYVTRFQVNKTYIEKFAIQTYGAHHNQEEDWIPADDLADFNANILGKIEIIDQYQPATQT